MPALKDDKSGNWISRFYYTDYNGERKQKFKRGFKTKKEAMEFEREFISKSEFSVTMSFRSLYELYIEDIKHRLKPGTIALRESIFNINILPFFENYKINEITPILIRKFQNSLITSDKKYTNSYLKLMNTTLNSLFNYAIQFHKLEINPCTKAGSIGSKKSTEMNIWTIEEFKLFCEIAKEKEVIYTIMNILFWTGMRLGEMLALEVKDIDFENKTIAINKSFSKIKGKDIIGSTKTQGSTRIIKINSQLVEILNTYISKIYDHKENTRLFFYQAEWIRINMKKIARKAGIKIIRVHDLRHSHASLLIHLGINPLLISKRLGHEKVDTTLNVYSHLYPDSSEKMIELLEKL